MTRRIRIIATLLAATAALSLSATASAASYGSILGRTPGELPPPLLAD
jgi:hypothetical protein